MDVINVTIGDSQVINVSLGDETPDYAKIVKYQGVVADTTLTDVIPAGYLVDNIVFHETASASIIGLKCGTTPGGEDVADIFELEADGSELVEPNAPLNFDSAQTLYVSATTYNGSIDIYVHLKRIA